MTLKAKPVLADKFWIVEKEGVKIGTLSKDDEGFVITQSGKINLYKSENALKKTFGKDFLIASVKKETKTQKRNFLSLTVFPKETYLFCAFHANKSFCFGFYFGFCVSFCS